MHLIERIFGVGINAATPNTAIDLSSADGWLLLAPYGETPYWHQDKGGAWKHYRQVFNHAQAERMVAAFRTLSARKGESFRGLPIYAGHPDADPVRWPDERRLGGVMGLEARGDGLYARRTAPRDTSSTRRPPGSTTSARRGAAGSSRRTNCAASG